MAERIEFVGNPLPTGLPGFGGGTVSVLTLPGFNTVVAVQQFGPVVDAPEVTVPDDIPPVGSNPADPTPEVVTPGEAPTGPAGPGKGTFCEECKESDPKSANDPLLIAREVRSSCRGCNGDTVSNVTWFRPASDGNKGVFLYQKQGLEGKGTSNWKLDASEGRATLYLDDLEMTSARGGGPRITGPDGKEYKPYDINVCKDGEPATWKFLAHEPEEDE
jgi:hypothetical protein